MTSAKTLLEVENRVAGKTVPGWRIQLVQYLGIGMFLLGGFTERFDWNLWAVIGTIVGFIIVTALLLVPYQKNSIR